MIKQELEHLKRENSRMNRNVDPNDNPKAE